MTSEEFDVTVLMFSRRSHQPDGLSRDVGHHRLHDERTGMGDASTTQLHSREIRRSPSRWAHPLASNRGVGHQGIGETHSPSQAELIRRAAAVLEQETPCRS